MQKTEKRFKAQNLRGLLVFFLILTLAAGGAAFYYGLDVVKSYSEEVNQRIADAEASGNQVEQLQVLKSQLSESSSLVSKANKLLIVESAYQSQALSDIRNYANASNLDVSRTSFDDNEPATVVVTLASPLSYKSLIKFLSNIEGNLPKMQVTSIKLKAVSGGSSDSVNVGEIKIQVSVK